MRLRETMVNEIIAHAQQGAPEEVVGILAGSNGRVEKLYRATNVAKNPRQQYLMDSREQLRIMREIESHGWDMVGIYHSHPESPARPSQTDIKLAGYPDAVYVIVSLKDRQKPVMRAFHIEDNNIREEELAVEK
ncbi:MAG: M67 family metallopeptidase [Chloroflexi bacterium]|nr:M67 family metallopeptidase [Chloroflexota bacterium]